MPPCARLPPGRLDTHFGVLDHKAVLRQHAPEAWRQARTRPGRACHLARRPGDQLGASGAGPSPRASPGARPHGSRRSGMARKGDAPDVLLAQVRISTGSRLAGRHTRARTSTAELASPSPAGTAFDHQNQPSDTWLQSSCSGSDRATTICRTWSMTPAPMSRPPRIADSCSPTCAASRRSRSATGMPRRPTWSAASSRSRAGRSLAMRAPRSRPRATRSTPCSRRHRVPCCADWRSSRPPRSRTHGNRIGRSASGSASTPARRSRQPRATSAGPSTSPRVCARRPSPARSS